MRTLSLLALAIAAPASATDVTVDAGKTHQTIDGFGTCLVAWEGRYRDLYRTPEFQKTYAEGVGCNMLRVNMWGPTYPKPTEDWTAIRYQDFDMAADGGRPQIFLDFGKGVRKLNPDFKVIGTAWSPPAWMKVNESITDKKSGAIQAGGYKDFTNRVDPKYFKHFCKWMVEYVKRHDKEGVPFHAVSPGNEVQFTQTFESCVWDAKDFNTIVAMLREMLDAEGYKHVLIFGPETMTSHLYEGGTGSYIKAVLNDPKALAAVGAFATHGYEDGVRAETAAGPFRKVSDLIRASGKPLWLTEGGTGGHDWPAPIRAGGVGNALHNSLAAGNATVFVPWQITERGKTTHALMSMANFTPKTYTAMHYFKHIKPGARRIDAEPGFDAVQVSAFRHDASGDLTVVAINPTDKEQPLNLTFRGLPGVTSLKAYRTSAAESLNAVGDVPVADGKASFQMAPLSIVTFTGTAK